MITLCSAPARPRSTQLGAYLGAYLGTSARLGAQHALDARGMAREVRERRTAQRGDASLVGQAHLRQTAGATLEIRESEVRLERGRLERDCGHGVDVPSEGNQPIIRRQSDCNHEGNHESNHEGNQTTIGRQSDGAPAASSSLRAAARSVSAWSSSNAE